jgi:cytochrome c-type biogenesis protein CcmH
MMTFGFWNEETLMTSLSGYPKVGPVMLRWILPSALILALLVAAWPLTHAHADRPPTRHDVASGLMCQCGCALTVAACQESMPCNVSDSVVQEIDDQIAEGKSKGEILDYFATIYGEEILSTPRKSGFGLMAWVMPFLAVIVGAAALAALVGLWARGRPALSEAPVAAEPTGDLNTFEQRVEEDLRLLE